MVCMNSQHLLETPSVFSTQVCSWTTTDLTHQDRTLNLLNEELQSDVSPTKIQNYIRPPQQLSSLRGSLRPSLPQSYALHTGNVMSGHWKLTLSQTPTASQNTDKVQQESCSMYAHRIGHTLGSPFYCCSLNQALSMLN